MKRTTLLWGLLAGLLVLGSPGIVQADPLDGVVGPEIVGFQEFDLASDAVIVADGEAIQFLAGTLRVVVYRLSPTPPPIHAQPTPPPIHLVRTSLEGVTALHLESGLLFTAHGVVDNVLQNGPPPISPIAFVGLTRLVPQPPPINEGPVPPPIRFTPTPPPIRLLFSYELTFDEGSVSIDQLKLGDGAGDIVLD